jgi:hypothetical protein
MCTAFHAAGVYQQVGTLDALQGLAVRQGTQPAVMRALCLCRLRGLAQRGIEGCADVVDQDAAVGRQQAGRCHQGQGVFFVTQVAHHHHAQVACRFGLALAGARRLVNHSGLDLQLWRQSVNAQALQHHQ